MTSNQAKITGRTKTFSRNIELEGLLNELNANLWIAEQEMLRSIGQKQAYPIILIMGPMRSGTTLFMQWLANTGLVAYPTNLLSRFYQAPMLGAKIQLLLTDPRFNFRDELGEFVQQGEFQSENGKTKGVLAPNEFWYFWRRFLAETDRDVWSDHELSQTMDVASLKAELIGIMDVFKKPFVAKGMLFNYNIPFLDSVLDKVLFIQIKRDPRSNVASVLEARKRQFGSESEWYSFQIPEYEQLKELDPINQISGQVTCINRAVDKGLITVDENRKLVVPYEDFCASPMSFYERIAEKINLPKQLYTGPQKFKAKQYKPTEDLKRIEIALKKFSEK